LYLFPTKALSQDQIRGIAGFDIPDVRMFVYDGDTPSSVRQSARRGGRLIVTNPDMLHAGILPNHPKWVKIFDGLRYVVLDELHTYRGVFGSHLANVIRRLLRVASFYNSRPLFIASSATIANPAGHFRELTGFEPEVIDRSGAPSGPRHYIIYNPPLVVPEQGIRRGVVLESAAMARRFVRGGFPTIVFARSRLNTEVILSYLKKSFGGGGAAGRGGLEGRGPGPGAGRIAGYRGGYLPGERREIERGLKDGSISCVVSTNALELGVDIGGLDVSVMAGFPGSVSSFHQQSGRAGRATGASLSVLICSNSPLDQYIARHPEFLMEGSPEAALVNPQNVYVLVDQVKCAAFELPFRKGERFGEEDVSDVLGYLAEQEVVHAEEGAYHWQDRSYPAENVSIRSADIGNFVIVLREHGGRRVIGEMDRASVPMILFQDAVYIHGSEQFKVVELDWDQQTAYVERSRSDYYTDAVTKTDIKILEKSRAQEEPGYRALLSDVLVRTVATKYKKIKFQTHENVGYGDINLPSTEMHTRSLVLCFREYLFGGMSRDQRENLLLALGHLLRNIAPVYVLTDSRDIGTAENLKQPVLELPALFLYDRYPGGVGLADRLFEVREQLLAAALWRIRECGCAEGCPSCVGPERYNKELALGFLKKAVAGREESGRRAQA
ncbi:MAG: DEAD/DEAH box helicase, partial [Spirochaetota bacterium]